MPTRASWIQRRRRPLGWTMLIVGLLAMVGGIHELLDGPGPGTWGGLALTLILVGAGATLLWRARRDARAGLPDPADEATFDPAAVELRVLEIARSSGGRLTAAEASLEVRLPFEVVRARLERLADRGACGRLVTEDGVVVYRFAEFENPAAKRDLLEPPRG
jgi:hypothetical protein